MGNIYSVVWGFDTQEGVGDLSFNAWTYSLRTDYENVYLNEFFAFEIYELTSHLLKLYGGKVDDFFAEFILHFLQSLTYVNDIVDEAKQATDNIIWW